MRLPSTTFSSIFNSCSEPKPKRIFFVWICVRRLATTSSHGAGQKMDCGLLVRFPRTFYSPLISDGADLKASISGKGVRCLMSELDVHLRLCVNSFDFRAGPVSLMSKSIGSVLLKNFILSPIDKTKTSPLFLLFEF